MQLFCCHFSEEGVTSFVLHTAKSLLSCTARRLRYENHSHISQSATSRVFSYGPGFTEKGLQYHPVSKPQWKYPRRVSDVASVGEVPIYCQSNQHS